MHTDYLRHTVRKLFARESLLAFLLSLTLLPSAAARPEAPAPAEQVQQAREHQKRAALKVEKAEAALDKAADEAFGSDGYARDVVAPYREKIRRAELERAIAEDMAREARQEAATQKLHRPAVNEYEVLLKIVKAKQEALDDARALLEEKVRDFLNQVEQDTKPDEPTVVDILYYALRDREAAERELQRAREAEAVDAAQRGLGAKIGTEDPPTTGTQ